jgi:hypothetical protein
LNSFINRFDAAKTCPVPWSYVDKKAKVLKLKVCHLTQFALFWTFEAENGILEFDKGTNGMQVLKIPLACSTDFQTDFLHLFVLYLFLDTISKLSPRAVIEEDNNNL